MKAGFLKVMFSLSVTLMMLMIVTLYVEDENYIVRHVAAAAIDPIRVNFGSSVTGYLTDVGTVYGSKGDYDYGWNVDNTANARYRDWNVHDHAEPPPDELPPEELFVRDARYDSLVHMQLTGDYSWEIGVGNGWYFVHVVAGDVEWRNGTYRINVEGELTVDGKPSKAQHWVSGSRVVEVTDGRLTLTNHIDATGNNKLAYIEIWPLPAGPSGFSSEINFQQSSNITPSGYLVDDGSSYGPQLTYTTTLTYGWNVDNQSKARDRSFYFEHNITDTLAIDQRYDTLNHMQPGNQLRDWEIAVPNGTYAVYLVNGDPQYFHDHVYDTLVEGIISKNGTGMPTNRLRAVSAAIVVDVTDGRLSIDNGLDAAKNKIQFIEIQQIGG